MDDYIHPGKSPRGNTYISVKYHDPNGGGREHKSKWDKDVTHAIEFELFCMADNTEHRWQSKSYLFSIKDGGDFVVGDKGERIAQFRGDDNAKLWHGYPVKQPIISRDLIRYWHENGIISNPLRKKLNQRKPIC